MNFLKDAIDSTGLCKKKELLELSMDLEFMYLPQELELIPLNITCFQGVVIITLGVKTHSFLYANIYKKFIESYLFRYFLGESLIKVEFSPV